jgi:hypothetical protein
MYESIRNLRQAIDNNQPPTGIEKIISPIITNMQNNFSSEWLIAVEILEIMSLPKVNSALRLEPWIIDGKKNMMNLLHKASQSDETIKKLISNGLNLITA